MVRFMGRRAFALVLVQMRPGVIIACLNLWTQRTLNENISSVIVGRLQSAICI